MSSSLDTGESVSSEINAAAGAESEEVGTVGGEVVEVTQIQAIKSEPELESDFSTSVSARSASGLNSCSRAKPKSKMSATTDSERYCRTNTSISSDNQTEATDNDETCLLCGNSPYYQYHKLRQAGKGSKIWCKWKQDCGRSICTLLSLSEKFHTVMTRGPYCKFCSTIVWDLHYTLKEFKCLQEKLYKIQLVMEEKIGKYHRDLVGALSDQGHEPLRRTRKVNVKVAPYKSKKGGAPTIEKKLRIVDSLLEGVLSGKSNPNIFNMDFFRTELNLWTDLQEQGQDDEDVGGLISAEDVKVFIDDKSLPASPRSVSNPAPARKQQPKRNASAKCEEMISNLLREGSPDFSPVDDGCSDGLEDDDDGNGSTDDEWITPDPKDTRDEPPINIQRLKKPRLKENDRHKSILPTSKKSASGSGHKKKGRSTDRTNDQTPVKKVNCEFCPDFLGTVRSLEDHTRLQHPDYRFKCKVCSKEFKLPTSLEFHINTFHNVKFAYHCRTCTKGFDKEEELTEHEAIHLTSETPFVCTDCNEVFTNSKDLERHVLSHINPFKCPDCFKCYKSQEELDRHMKHHKRSVQCDLCGLSCFSDSRLKQHMASHSTEKKYQCDQCHLSYKYAKGLKMHQRIHNGVRPFACKVCLKPFYDSGHLKKHEEIHSGTRTYICKTCGKSFVAAQNLRQHERIHNPNTIRKKRIRPARSANKPTTEEDNNIVTIPLELPTTTEMKPNDNELQDYHQHQEHQAETTDDFGESGTSSGIQQQHDSVGVF